jgi:hypothetical protein
MEEYGEVEIELHIFLNSEPVGVSDVLHTPAALPLVPIDLEAG